MAISESQRLARQSRIGSSDAAAVLGLDPYRSAADVWLEKTGQAEGFEGNENTERGNLLEPVLLKWAADQLHFPYWCDLSFVHSSGRLIANLDAADNPAAPAQIIEAKTTVDIEGWGEPGTDQVPERVNVQVHHQFVCVPSARVAWVPVLLPGFKKFDWRLYRVERNDELCAMVETAGLDFMNRYVTPRVQPDDYRPSIEVLKRVRREPGTVVPVADELVERYLDATKECKLATEAKERAQSYLLASLGDAEGGQYSGGMVTFLTTKRKGYTVEPTEYRSLKVKAAKPEKKQLVAAGAEGGEAHV